MVSLVFDLHIVDQPVEEADGEFTALNGGEEFRCGRRRPQSRIFAPQFDGPHREFNDALLLALTKKLHPFREALLFFPQRAAGPLSSPGR